MNNYFFAVLVLHRTIARVMLSIFPLMPETKLMIEAVLVHIKAEVVCFISKWIHLSDNFII